MIAALVRNNNGSSRRAAVAATVVRARTTRSSLSYVASSRTFAALASTTAGGQRRFKSSVPVDGDVGSNGGGSGGCPFSGAQRERTAPTLKHIPTLPFVGSFLHRYSGTPPFDPKSIYRYGPIVREKWGEFFTNGFPGFGKGLNGTIYNIVDPDEMMKVIRAEGKYPSGLVQRAEFLKAGLKNDKSAIFDGNDDGLLGQGERWKRQRTVLQTGMLDPKSANGFLPMIQQAARLASASAPEYASRGELNRYLNYAAFDMFNSFMFGDLTKAAATYYDAVDDDDCSGTYDGDSTSDPEATNAENVRFCKAAVTSMEESSNMSRSPYEILMHRIGFKVSTHTDT